ncbi:ComEC/Rec2 family competence protein [Maribacter polysaccharolyticus]|uniref:ComEC/Rec2 family competence protein n=1 Tax=Maribacter polysaccharolyticus TaxID=3020831 RepID=UPI00237F54F4|nr:ComEC/Rec2 family competence protein [Maribacter polysaccharolyticus]MDE3742882.1 ComEC/Rec2 family competence protein [Maribacter polysaccharolyticus]
MKLLQFIPIKLTFFLVMGILAGYHLDLGIYWPLALTLSSVACLGFFRYSKSRPKSVTFGITAACTTLFLGMLIVGISQPKNDAHHYSKANTDDLGAWKLKITDVLKSTTFSNRFIADVEAFDAAHVTGKIIVSLPADASPFPLQVDDELIVLAKRTEIPSPLNPHQFDYRQYLEKQGIYHQLKMDPQNTILLKNPKKTLLGRAASVRNTIRSALQQAAFGENELGIIQALFLGQRNDISEATYTAYKNAGAVHILAVSGLHIGILLLFLEFLLRPMELLPKGKVLKLITIVILLWGFAFLAGLSASVVRAVTMFSFVAYALYLNRPSNTFNILALSMFFILLAINPMLLFHVGFQMSYAAVFSIVWIYPLLQRFWFPKNWMVNKIWQLLSVSIAAQIGVLPISLFYFHQFPGLFFISNLLIIPFLGFILGLGIIVIALVVLDLAPDALIFFYDYVIRLMNGVIDKVAQQEAFIFRDIPFDSVQLILTYVMVLTLVSLLHQYTFKRLRMVLVAVIALQVWSLTRLSQAESKARLLVAHQTKNTIVMHRSGNQLTVFTPDSISSKNIITDYVIGEHIATTHFKPLENVFDINGGKMLIIDSLGVIPTRAERFDLLLLTQSPKINLERLLDSLQPKSVIADGSNYGSYIKRWTATCAQRKLPMHYTGEKGIFELDLE